MTRRAEAMSRASLSLLTDQLSDVEELIREGESGK